MPQVFLLAALGAGLYAGYRALLRAGEKMAAELKRSEDEVQQRTAPRATGPQHEKDLGTLEFDPRSGVYKPVPPAH